MPITMRVKLDGLDKLLEIFKKIDVKYPATELLKEFGAAVVEEAKAISPVRTGYLRSRIQSRTMWGSLWLGTDCPYAPWVEFGTRFMAPRPHMAPAVLKVSGEFEMMLARSMDVYFRELMGS